MNITRRTILKGIIGGAAALALPGPLIEVASPLPDGPLVGAEADELARRYWSLGRWRHETDTQLLQRLIDEAHARGGGTVLLKTRAYYLDAPVNVKSNVAFVGHRFV